MSVSACGKCRSNKIAAVVKRQEYDLRSTIRAYLGRGAQSIKNRHRDVHHQHIGIKALDLLNCIAAVSH